MNKVKMAILEKAFCREIDGALTRHAGILQTRSKIADRLVDDGCLERVTEHLGGRFPVKITGYRLTHLGRLIYCLSCTEGEGDKP